MAGSEPASPAIISEKKMPIESTIEVFWNVVLIPPPTPRRLAGREFMIAARLGEANSPIPKPLAKRAAANIQ